MTLSCLWEILEQMATVHSVNMGEVNGVKEEKGSWGPPDESYQEVSENSCTSIVLCWARVELQQSAVCVGLPQQRKIRPIPLETSADCLPFMVPYSTSVMTLCIEPHQFLPTQAVKHHYKSATIEWQQWGICQPEIHAESRPKPAITDERI